MPLADTNIKPKHNKIKGHYTMPDTECLHIPENGTLIKLPRRIMVHPASYDYFCTCCGKTFRFIEGKDGELQMEPPKGI